MGKERRLCDYCGADPMQEAMLDPSNFGKGLVTDRARLGNGFKKKKKGNKGEKNEMNPRIVLWRWCLRGKD
jgi:hypothetical protein